MAARARAPQPAPEVRQSQAGRGGRKRKRWAAAPLFWVMSAKRRWIAGSGRAGAARPAGESAAWLACLCCLQPAFGLEVGSASRVFFLLLLFLLFLIEICSLVPVLELPLCGCCFAKAVTDGRSWIRGACAAGWSCVSGRVSFASQVLQKCSSPVLPARSWAELGSASSNPGYCWPSKKKKVRWPFLLCFDARFLFFLLEVFGVWWSFLDGWAEVEGADTCILLCLFLSMTLSLFWRNGHAHSAVICFFIGINSPF